MVVACCSKSAEVQLKVGLLSDRNRAQKRRSALAVDWTSYEGTNERSQQLGYGSEDDRAIRQ